MSDNRSASSPSSLSSSSSSRSCSPAEVLSAEKRKMVRDLVATLSPCERAAYHTKRLERAFAPPLSGLPWSPLPRSLAAVLEAEVRTAISVIQGTVDLDYKLNDFAKLGRSNYRALKVALDSVLSMLHMVFSWLERRSLAVTLEHPFAHELLFPEEALNMLRILRVIMLHFGYDSRPHCLSLVETLSEDARSTHSLLQGATKFPGFKSTGELVANVRLA
ncbi:hypothetical protein C8R45DRAFT_1214355 [Mycena sanguinolenta]|nr:hypothetical protein C8R45DRAFT_1214355 [Mycena sanguinolenta]